MTLTKLDHIMIHFAAERAPVQLDDGRTGRLVAWKPTRRKRRSVHEARVEFPSGRRATVSIRQLAGIVGDDGTLFPLQGEEPGERADTDTTDLLIAGRRQGSRGDLPPVGLLDPQRAHTAGRGPGTGQRPSPPLHSRRGPSVDRSRQRVPVSAGDPPGHDGRTPVGDDAGVPR